MLTTHENTCKICNASPLKVFAHTAKCTSCGVLLYYPYPEDDDNLRETENESKNWKEGAIQNWYGQSSMRNHHNFTNILDFVFDRSGAVTPMDFLDYGGGGGQFALVCVSQFIKTKVYIVDIDDDALYEPWKSVNHQIKYLDFKSDGTRFDVIFLNDLFEHVSDPSGLLETLTAKLKPGGKIFVDTPRQFWLYPVLERLYKPLFTKLLVGTVSIFHLQIWSGKSFRLIVERAGLKIDKYRELSEYTMPADFYLKNMKITNPIIRWMAHIFYANSKWLARNKIICLLSKKD